MQTQPAELLVSCGKRRAAPPPARGASPQFMRLTLGGAGVNVQNVEMQRLPAIFLSSTFYDLRQVRFDVATFVEQQLGYWFLASEHSSFPLEPTLDTIENCRKRVENDVDIFVLIVGGRYGSIPENHTLSVTNIEYASARAKGLPIFSFVQRDILALLPVWNRSPGADFSAVVDTPKLFEFIEQVRTVDRVWMFPFDTAQDIISTLRTQLAYEMCRGLEATRLQSGHPREFADLPTRAFRLAVDKPRGWQSLFVAELLEYEFVAAERTLRQHRQGIATGAGERVAEDEISEWISAMTAEGHNIISQLSTVSLRVLNEAAAANDIASLRFGVQAVVAALHSAFEWSNRVRRAHVPEEWRAPIVTLSHYLDLSVDRLLEIPQRLRIALQQLLESGGGKGTLKIVFDVDEVLVRQFETQMAELRRKRWAR